ncbi:BlaI/MecI/CopY family transcriptional regulator [Streptomyces mirabilis]
MTRFGELEAAIMDAVWAAGKPLCVREVLERLDRDPEPAYNTVHTVTETLYRKGWLAKEKETAGPTSTEPPRAARSTSPD